MKKRVGILLVLFTAAFLVAVSFNPASANKTKASHGYDIRLSSVKIELSFPDGSILYAPRDFDGKSLDKLSATGGEAQELLDIAYKQLGIVKPAELPKAFALTQNHPNPFNPSTTINYDIPDGSSEVAVKLSVYNIRGQLVNTLVDDSQAPGSYSVNWDGADESGRKVSSGVYFYRLVAGDYVSTRKMVVLK